MPGTPLKTASMLYLPYAAPVNGRYAAGKFTKECSPTGVKCVLELGGQWTDLNKLADAIRTGGQWEQLPPTNGTESTERIAMATLPGLNADIAAMIPQDVFCRTPRMPTRGEGDTATLTIIGEQGLQAGYFPIGGDCPDGYAQGTGLALDPESMTVPAGTKFRTVYEPNDMELAYGLPFRSNYKWDLTKDLTGADLSFPLATVAIQVGNDKADAQANTLGDLLSCLGYLGGSSGSYNGRISHIAVCNIWREGGLTEQQKAALFQYLTSTDSAYNTSGTATQMGQGTAEYIKRILRGETSYREYVPHVTITRSYKNPPNLSDVTKWPPPGFLAIFTGGEYPSGYPPPWTSAPAVYDADAAIYYSYLWSGPQLEFTGEVWQVEAQCQGFVQIDKDLYSDPFAPVS